MNIDLPFDFTPRPYQELSWNVVMREDFKRGMLVWPRRNGKDLHCWNMCISKAMQRVGLYYYIAPYYNQGRQIIWEGADKNGRRFLDYIPQPIIGSSTKLDMRIKLINGSQIKLVGSDNIDSIVGTNPIGLIFTEFSLHKRGVWDYLRPILSENGGWALFNGTPRGMANEMYELYCKALRPDSNWFLQHITRDDTGVPTLEAIQEDRDSGMPEPLISQEYFTNFLTGNVGTYYSTEMEMLRVANRVTKVPYDPRLPVYTFWDLGKRDATAVWFMQFHQHEIRVIDYYEQVEKSLIHHIKHVKSLPYAYEAHYAPHDIKVEEMTTAISRWETASQHGIDFEVVPKIPLMDGIDAVREVLPRCWFDKERTLLGRRALEHYHKAYDAKGEVYSDAPAKSWANHGSDSFRMFAVVADTLIDLMGWSNKAPTVHRSVGRKPQRGNTRNPSKQNTFIAQNDIYGSKSFKPTRVNRRS